MANSITLKKKYLANVTSRAVISGSIDDKNVVKKAKTEVDESIEAITRAEALDSALAALRAELRIAEGNQKAAFIKSLKDEFSTEYAEYKKECQAVLTRFRRLQQPDTQLLGLTGRSEMGHRVLDLNLSAFGM